jgi:hypothetical protein
MYGIDAHDNRLWLVAAFSLTICWPLVAQDRGASITIGTTVVRIGMPVDTVIAQLQGQFKVSYHGKPPVTQIWISSNGREYPFATLYIRDRAVIGIDHDLLERDIETSDDMFDALFKVSSKVQDEHRADCRVESGTSYLPDAGLSKAFVNLNCGPYRVVLLRNQFKSSEGKLLSGYVAREELGQTD